MRSCLDAEILGLQIDERFICERFQHTIAQLQDKLGDRFAAEVQLPSSIELGFDLVASIFETNVREQIDNLKTALASQDLDRLQTTLTFTTEICTGLAESVKLPGFLAISQAIAAAMSRHPDAIAQIAELAIEHLQQARTEVLAGDRTHGGNVLTELAILAQAGEYQPVGLDSPLVNREFELIGFREFLTSDRFCTRQPLTAATQDFLLDTIRLCWDWFEQCADLHQSQLDLELLIAAENLPDLDYINHWVGLLLSQLREANDSLSLQAYRRSCLYQVVYAVAKYIADINLQFKISPEFLGALRSQLQTAVTLSQQYPPITATERAWLERITIPHPGAKKSLSTTPPNPALTSDDELLNQIWGQPQLLDRHLPATPSICDAETTVVAFAAPIDLSDGDRHQLIHPQQLQSLLADLYHQSIQHHRQLQNCDRDSQLQALPELVSFSENLTLCLSIALQAIEQIYNLTDRQEKLNYLNSLTVDRLGIVNN